MLIGSCLVAGQVAREAHGAFEYFQFDEGRIAWFDAVGHKVDTLTFQEFDHLTFINDQFSESHGLEFAGGNTVAYTSEAFVDGKGIASNYGVDLRFDEVQFGIGAEFQGFLRFKFFHGDTVVGPELGVLLGGPTFMGIGFHGTLSEEPFDRVLITNSPLFGIDDIHLTSIPSPGVLFVMLAPLMAGGRRMRRHS